MSFSSVKMHGVFSIVRDAHGGYKEEVGTVHKEELCDGCGKPNVLIIDIYGGGDEFKSCSGCLRRIADLMEGK